MSTKENTSEDNILAIAILISCFGFGYWTRSQDIINLVIRDFIGFPLSYIILDALVQIIMVGSFCIAVIGTILLQFDKREDQEIVKNKNERDERLRTYNKGVVLVKHLISSYR